MTLKRIGAAVGIAAVLVLPLTACGSSTPTTRVTVTATPTTTLSLAPCPPVNDPAWESCLNSHRAQRERDAAERQKQAAVKPAPQGGGIPWWVWVGGTIIGLGLLLWWGTTLDDGSSTRAARDDDDDDGGDDGQYPKPLSSAEERVLNEWEEREETRERAGQPSRRYPTTAELREMTRLGVQDYDQLPGNDSALTYPAIPNTPVAEPVPYPEPPSAPVQPAAPVASGSLMERLGGK